MKKRNLLRLLLAAAWCALLFPKTALSFGCTGGNTLTVAVSTSTFTSTKGTTFTLPQGVFRCSGSVDSAFQDAMRVRSVKYHTSLKPFARTLQAGSKTYANAAGTNTAISSAQNIANNNLCVWPDANCSTNTFNGQRNTLGISVKLVGTLGSLAKDITLATVILERRSNKSENPFNAETYTINFILQDKVEPPVYTCTISDYDATITLPSVRRTDLVSNGAGKYAAISKPLNLDLQCNHNTDVTITFNATALSGTDNVLKNTQAGNDNVGFQLLYGGNPVKVNNALLLQTGASGATNLQFDVYYYYKGSGDVNNGPIKSGAEFTLSYK